MHWFVLRCSPGKEIALQQSIQTRFGVECFVPIERKRQHDNHGRFVWRERCALSSYIFVRAEKEVFYTIPKTITSVHAMMRMEEGFWHLVIVNDKAMSDFIRVSGNKEERAVYLDPAKLHFKKGDRVRVIGGSFTGVEGYFMQIGGKHEKRVVIQLDQFIAVSTAAIPAALVEKV